MLSWSFITLVVIQLLPGNLVSVLSVLLSFIVIIYRKEILVVKHLFPLILILAIGVLSAFINLLVAENFTYYFLFRDIYYFVSPISFGYLCYVYFCYKGYSISNFNRDIVLSIAFVSIVYLINGVIGILTGHQVNVETRVEYGAYMYSVVGFAFLYFGNKNSQYYFGTFVTKYRKFLYLIFLISILFSFSRSTYLIFLVLLFIPILKQSWIKAVLPLLYFLIVIFVLFSSKIVQFENQVEVSSSLTNKIANSLSEIQVREMLEVVDINHNWRGYEAYMGVNEVINSSLENKFFGFGLGKVVYTPNWIFNNQEQYQTLGVIPVFHNGFITVLLKTGFIGIIIYIIFIANLGRITGLDSYHSYLSTFCSMTLFLHTLFLHGLYYTALPIVPITVCTFLLYISNLGSMKSDN